MMPVRDEGIMPPTPTERGYNKGWNAYHNGEILKSNPYDPSSEKEEYDGFIDGWGSAQLGDLDTNEEHIDIALDEGLRAREDDDDVYSLADFIDEVNCAAITNDDGTGYYGNATHRTKQQAVPNDIYLNGTPEEASYTHVYWYNK